MPPEVRLALRACHDDFRREVTASCAAASGRSHLPLFENGNICGPGLRILGQVIVSGRSRRQLDLIAQVEGALRIARIPFWVPGGWGVDFLAGEVLREHADIDLVCWAADIDRLSAALDTRGFQRLESPRPSEVRWFQKVGERLGVALLMRNDSGELLTSGGRFDDWPWRDDSLGGPPGCIGELVCPVVGLREQLSTKEGMACHPQGAPPRPHDLADIERLRELARARGLL